MKSNKNLLLDRGHIHVAPVQRAASMPPHNSDCCMNILLKSDNESTFIL